MLPPAEDKVVKRMRLWGHFSFKPTQQGKVYFVSRFSFLSTAGSIAFDWNERKHCGTRNVWHKRLPTSGQARGPIRKRKGLEKSCTLERYSSCDPLPLTKLQLLKISSPVNISGVWEVGSYDPITSQHYQLGGNSSTRDLVGILRIQTIRPRIRLATAPSEYRRVS